ncbi:carboxylating nicotinate-nucleotide diphosphorylase [Candidatus Bathyarchaeota archaeon]|nr:MAG: carboxylating nicotinate-nucleotide diphosphorylase [Candidatus Bathyarchaeota archaeon]
MLMRFLSEDVGMEDITTRAVIPEGTEARAQVIVKERAVVAGVEEIRLLFEMLGLKVRRALRDGVEVEPGTTIMEVSGDARTILTAERTALNILMRMSGIATATRRLVEKVREAGLKTKIAATRKTAPGLRYLDKKAVEVGGGDPHRFRLDDAVLIKDNHIAIVGGVDEAVRKARESVSFAKKVEVEVRTLDEALEAARSGADIIMLDNMTVEDVESTLRMLEREGLRDKVLIEVSGGITEENLLQYAKLEPDIISVGSLTHSVKAVDISLEVLGVQG